MSFFAGCQNSLPELRLDEDGLPQSQIFGLRMLQRFSTGLKSGGTEHFKLFFFIIFEQNTVIIGSAVN